MVLRTAFAEEPNRLSDVLVYDTPKEYCREVIDLQPGTYVMGQVVGKVTANSQYKGHDAALSDGAENAAGVLICAPGTITVLSKALILKGGPSVVKKDGLIWKEGISTPDMDAGIAALENLGIDVRE